MSRVFQLQTADGCVIEYTLKRSKRRKKTVQISVSKGAVEVSAPLRTPSGEIQAILEHRSAWIMRKLEAPVDEVVPLRFASGESLPYLGRTMVLAIEESGVRRASATLAGSTLAVTLPFGLSEEDGREAVRTALMAWYRAQAAELLAESVSRWLPVMGRNEMPRVLIREQKTRWGSCSADGTLRFSWRLAMVDRELIDSVAVHELAHLKVMNHSPDFWEVVLKAMPDAKERRRRLGEAGRNLPF